MQGQKNTRLFYTYVSATPEGFAVKVMNVHEVGSKGDMAVH